MLAEVIHIWQDVALPVTSYVNVVNLNRLSSICYSVNYWINLQHNRIWLMQWRQLWCVSTSGRRRSEEKTTDDGLNKKTHISADVQRITLNSSCIMISGGRTEHLYIIACFLPHHWLFEWFSQFHSCGTYSVLSRSPSITYAVPSKFSFAVLVSLFDENNVSSS